MINEQNLIKFKSFDDFLQNNNTTKNASIHYLLSSNFAEFLDENYSLKHLRDEFFYPKSLTLPKGTNILFLIKFVLIFNNLNFNKLKLNLFKLIQH